ncbi:Hypothetical predicted protein [Pelobates cultripes]|uniref:Uncharacterized protein n=1 Tax=Pelobates cultripes TaxID=61616 RepID=A0AAD1R9Y3_PELCU|nr:Hypothetical predicted protein [Pelobates cultripes]
MRGHNARLVASTMRGHNARLVASSMRGHNARLVASSMRGHNFQVPEERDHNTRGGMRGGFIPSATVPVLSLFLLLQPVPVTVTQVPQQSVTQDHRASATKAPAGREAGERRAAELSESRRREDWERQTDRETDRQSRSVSRF